MVFSYNGDVEIAENGVLSFENPNYIHGSSFVDSLNYNGNNSNSNGNNPNTNDIDVHTNSNVTTGTIAAVDSNAFLDGFPTAEINDSESTTFADDDVTDRLNNAINSVDSCGVRANGASTLGATTEFVNGNNGCVQEPTQNDVNTSDVTDFNNGVETSTKTAGNTGGNIAGNTGGNNIAGNTDRINGGSKSSSGTDKKGLDFASLDGGLAALDNLCTSLDQACQLSRSSSHRRRYASLHPADMGVDLTQGPVTTLGRHTDSLPNNAQLQQASSTNNNINNNYQQQQKQQPRRRQQPPPIPPRASLTKIAATSTTSTIAATSPTTAETSPITAATSPITSAATDNAPNIVVMGQRDNNNTSNNNEKNSKPDLIEDIARRHQEQQQQQQELMKEKKEGEQVVLIDNDFKKDTVVEEQDNRDVAKSPPPLMQEGGNEGDGSGARSDEGIPHMMAGEGQELYALPMKHGRPPAGQGSGLSAESPQSSGGSSADTASEKQEEALPPGWEKHEDNDGAYYWHIKSGTITRTPPTPATAPPHRAPAPHRRHKEEQMGVPRSTTSSALAELAELRPRSTNTAENAYKRRSYPVRSELSEAGAGGGRAIRFAVRSLGWLEVPEEELTPERSSKAVNRCIVDLSGGRRDVMDVVGCWGEGKDLFMDLDEGSLKLVDPENLTLLNSQPIHTIRVWGVGRDNGRERDFAYVARDRVSRKHMCQVFRCDTPARTIANTLRDICKKIMIERSLHQGSAKGDMGSCMGSSNSLLGSNGALNTTNGTSGRVTRPSNLPTEHRRQHRHSPLLSAQSFPTPMEEPKKVVKASYVGSLQVNRPNGMDVLNSAIEDAITNNPGPWDNVLVAVAPSTITITDAINNRQLAECRVRFLSFLGIGRRVNQCAFIMHTAQDQFVAHVFQCEPSSGALCKTIEAACKLRYQKCLDAYPTGGSGTGVGVAGGRLLRGGDQRGVGSVAATLRNVFTSFAGVRGKKATSS